jgi:hypothetical protein
LKGIDQKEIDTHKKGNDSGCLRYGDHNHWMVDCYASKSKAGTELPRLNTSSISIVIKRKPVEEPEEDAGTLVPFKQQKTAAVITNDDNIRKNPIWTKQSDSGEDFQ